MALKFGMGFLGGLHFGTDIFGGFDFCPHSIIPVTEIQSTPLATHALIDQEACLLESK